VSRQRDEIKKKENFVHKVLQRTEAFFHAMAQSGDAKKGADAARGGRMLSTADGKKAEIGDTKGTGRESLSTEVVAELRAAICQCFNPTMCVGGINYLCIYLSACLSLSLFLSLCMHAGGGRAVRRVLS
jgi:hypothetical protein